MKRILMVSAMACMLASASVAAAAQADGGGDDSGIWFPLGLSLVSAPVQLPSSSHTVFGAMVNVGYGQVRNLAVIDVGIVNNVTEGMTGLEFGAVNLAGTCVGAQAGGVNYASTLVGVQLGILNITGRLHGLQLGLVNISSSGGALIFPIFNLGF